MCEFIKQPARKFLDTSPFAQSGKPDDRPVYPVIQITSESALPYGKFDVLMRRADKSKIHLSRCPAAEAAKSLGFEYAKQSGLERKWHIADLVEKQCPAVGQFDFSRSTTTLRSSESTFYVAEQFAFNQVLGDRRAINRYQPPGIAGCCCVGI